MFFQKWKRGVPLERCPDNDGHNVDTIDGLVLPGEVRSNHHAYNQFGMDLLLFYEASSSAEESGGLISPCGAALQKVVVGGKQLNIITNW